MKRGLKYTLWSLLILIIVLPLAVLAILSTESGTRWLLGQAGGWLSGQGYQLSIGRSEGRLSDRISLHDVTFDMDDTHFAAARVMLEWRPWALADSRLHVVALEVADSTLVLPPSEPSDSGPLTIPDLVLPIEIVVDRAAIERFTFKQAESTYFVDEFNASAAVDDEQLALRALSFSGIDVKLSGDLAMGACAPYALSGSAALQIAEALTGPDVGYVAANVSIGGEALHPKVSATVTDPTMLKLEGNVELAEAAPVLDIAASWQTLSWPLKQNPVATLKNGRLQVNGSVEDYRLQLKADVEAESAPPGSIDVALRGDLNGIVIEPAVVDALEGRATINGSLNWQNNLEWLADLDLEGINPQPLAADWPGKIGGKVHVSGSLDTDKGGEPQIAVAIQSLGGTLRGYPVNAQGDVAIRGTHLQAKQLTVASGPNRLDLDGRWDDSLDLKFALTAPDLAKLYPGLSGQLDGNGTVSGTAEVPVVVATLAGKSVAYQGSSADGLDLNIDWRGKDGTGRLRATGIDVQGTRLDTLEADIDGALDAHNIKFKTAGDVGELDLAARGGWKAPLWQGTLDRLAVNEPSAGQWSLRKPTALILGAEQAETEQLCLGSGSADVCVVGGWQAKSGLNVAGRLQGLELAELFGAMPGNAVVNGTLKGSFKVVGPAERPNADFELAPGDGEIRFEDADEPIVLPYRNARISGSFKDDQGKADLSFDLGAAGQVQGAVTLGPAKEGDRVLGGGVTAQFPDLSLVAGFVPQLEQVEGGLRLQARVGGSLAKPRVQGELVVADANARIAAAGIELKDVGLTVRSAGDGPVSVQGQLTSGEGTLLIDGNVVLSGSGGPVADLKVKGNDVLVAQLPEAQVKVSPDLTLTGSGPYHLAGVVRVPLAKIELKELPPSTVKVSDDEIIIDGDKEPETAAGPRNLTADVRVELGDDVTFSGFGLKTGLAGAINASVDAKGTNAQGKIELRDGQYRAYGQDLKVERGRLFFAGPPSSPDVDLRASRTSFDGKYKAILSLQGPLSNPTSRVFTEPSTSQAESLAFLLSGAGLSEADGEQGSRILSAAYSLGLARGEPLLQQLSDRLGLDDLRVDTGNGLEDSSLVLGKYLNPDLYLGYTQGLFDPDGAVLMRLKLTEQIEVETRSSDEQSVDLFYRIEHD